MITGTALMWCYNNWVHQALIITHRFNFLLSNAEKWKEREAEKRGAQVFSAHQPLFREDVVCSVRTPAHLYFAKKWALLTRRRVLIRGAVLSNSLSPTLSQMSTRWKECRKSSTSAETKEESTARTAQCVFYRAYTTRKWIHLICK